ncbi:MAG: hypothetical protein IJJ47_00980 [Methanosphaera sp.]|nr:hypothetical protein [Methanosphaera sp.]
MDIQDEHIKENDVLKKLDEYLDTTENEYYNQKQLRLHDLRGKINIDSSLTEKYRIEKSLYENIPYVLDKIKD